MPSQQWYSPLYLYFRWGGCWLVPRAGASPFPLSGDTHLGGQSIPTLPTAQTAQVGCLKCCGTIECEV